MELPPQGVYPTVSLFFKMEMDLIEDQDAVINHVAIFFESIWSKEDWVRPRLDNLVFDETGELQASWFQRDFEESKVRQVLLNSVRYRPPGPDGFPLAFFQRFWEVLKQDILAFMKEFHSRSKLCNQIRASFIALIPKKVGADCIKEFFPINLIGFIYKILD